MVQQRTLTSHHKEVANRLRSIYDSRKGELGLTQTKIAKALDMRQSAVSQYLNGQIATNVEIILKFAALLRVKPEEIDPDLLRIHSLRTYGGATKIPMRYTMMGDAPSVAEITLQAVRTDSDQCYGVEINTPSYSPFLPEGTVLVIDPSVEPIDGDLVFAVFTNGKRAVGRYDQGNSGSETQCLVPLNPAEPSLMLERSLIDGFDLVIGTEQPTGKTRVKRQ